MVAGAAAEIDHRAAGEITEDLRSRPDTGMLAPVHLQRRWKRSVGFGGLALAGVLLPGGPVHGVEQTYGVCEVAADGLEVGRVGGRVGDPVHGLVHEPFGDPDAVPAQGPSFGAQPAASRLSVPMAAGRYVGVDQAADPCGIGRFESAGPGGQVEQAGAVERAGEVEQPPSGLPGVQRCCHPS